MNSTEALVQGILSSPLKAELRIRRNQSGKYSVRVYSNNRLKIAHAEGDTIGEALNAATTGSD